MEGNPVIHSLAGKENKTIDRQRRLFCKQLDDDIAFFCFEGGSIFFIRVNHGGRAFFYTLLWNILRNPAYSGHPNCPGTGFR